MRPFLEGGVGNPAALHSHGLEARASLDGARAKVARLIGGVAGGVIFTASATEANNLAIKGVALRAPRPPRRHLRRRARLGRQPLPRSREAGLERHVAARSIATGCVDPEAVARALRDDTALRVDHGRQRRDRHAAVGARARPPGPRARRAVPRRRGRRRRPAAAQRGRVRDRPADAVVQRPVRAAGRRRAVGARGGAAGADHPRRRAGGRLPLGHREPAGHRRHGRRRRPRAQRAGGRGGAARRRCAIGCSTGCSTA